MRQVTLHTSSAAAWTMKRAIPTCMPHVARTCGQGRRQCAVHAQRGSRRLRKQIGGDSFVCLRSGEPVSLACSTLLSARAPIRLAILCTIRIGHDHVRYHCLADRRVRQTTPPLIRALQMLCELRTTHSPNGTSSSVITTSWDAYARSSLPCRAPIARRA